MVFRPGLPLFSLPVNTQGSGIAQPFDISFTGDNTVTYNLFGTVPDITLTFSHTGDTPVSEVRVVGISSNADIDVTDAFTLTPTFTLNRDTTAAQEYSFRVTDANGDVAELIFTIRFNRSVVDRPVFGRDDEVIEP